MHEDSNGQNMLITESLRKDMPKASVAGYTIPLYAAPQPQAPSSDDVRDKRIAELEAKIHTLTNRADMRRKHLRRLEAALADARNSALEEAAKVCEQRSPRTWEEIPDDLPTRQDISDEESHACAAAIRALRTTSEK
jgi:hypothetical protein